MLLGGGPGFPANLNPAGITETHRRQKAALRQQVDEVGNERESSACLASSTD